MKTLRMCAATAALLLAWPAMAETLSNQSIVTLSATGIGDEAIIAKIKSTNGVYDLSTDQMIALKQKGVSGPVIAAMLASANKAPAAAAMSVDSPDPTVPHPSGVYLLDATAPGGRLQRIDATVSNQAKTGGILGYALTSGIASMSVKAAIQNEHARVTARSNQPTFYFFFDESNPASGAQASAWAAGTAATVTSPNEFTLVRLMSKKGRREARVGSANIGGVKTGVMDKDRLAFDYQVVRPGVYKVTPNDKLALGEYGFIYSLTGGGGAGAMTARIFDFSVQAAVVNAAS